MTEAAGPFLSTRQSLPEYLLQGALAGLMALAAVRVESGTTFGVAPAFGFLLAGLSLFASTLVRKKGHPKPKVNGAFALVLMALDSPLFVAAGAVVGVSIGRLIGGWGLWLLAGGLIGGFSLGLARFAMAMPKKWTARWIAAFAVPVLATAAILASMFVDTGLEIADGFGPFVDVFLCNLLLLILVVIGRAEEGDAEIGMVVGGLGLSLSLLALPPTAKGIVVLAPLALYVVYFVRIRKGLLAIKHVVRALDAEQSGNRAEALGRFQRASAILPGFEAAEEGKWRIHRQLTVAEIADDPLLIALVDPTICLDRARKLIDSPTSDVEQLQEAEQLLDIVSARRPDMSLANGIERLKALVLMEQFDKAGDLARELLATTPLSLDELTETESTALYRAWHLAFSHKELRNEAIIGTVNDERMLFAISAVERRLRDSPGDKHAAELKVFLYSKVSPIALERYRAIAPADSLDWFDFKYCRELAQGLVADPAAASRVIELLLIAANGLPKERLELWRAAAELLERHGRDEEALTWRRRIREQGLEAGIASLSPGDQDAFFSVCRLFAERAERAGDLPQAIVHYQWFARSPHSGLETIRKLLVLSERMGDILGAIRCVESAFRYQLSDIQKSEWQVEKRRLYDLLDPGDVAELQADERRFLDFGYCLEEAKRLLEANAPRESVSKYLDLASLAEEGHAPELGLLRARTHLRENDVESACRWLEQVMRNRPARFASARDEESYFQACRLLGDLALGTLNSPALAIEAFQIYKDYLKSGADTLLKLAQAYESAGQPARAKKWYDMVLVYPKHPAAESARQALDRLS